MSAVSALFPSQDPSFLVLDMQHLAQWRDEEGAAVGLEYWQLWLLGDFYLKHVQEKAEIGVYSYLTCYNWLGGWVDIREFKTFQNWPVFW